MKKGAAFFAVFTLSLFYFTSSWAVPIQIDFTANNFVDTLSPLATPYNPIQFDDQTPIPSPYDVISGSVIYESESPNSAIHYLKSIDLSIGFHTYSLSDIDFVSLFNNLVIGGKYEGPAYIHPGIDDFWLAWNPETLSPVSFGYSTGTLSLSTWSTEDFENFDVSVVPEPSTFILLAAGLVIFVAKGLRKRN